MDVTYISAHGDSSGYAEAARNYIAALDKVGVKVEAVPVSFESFKAPMGKLGAKIKSLTTREPKAKIRILHLTPDNYPRMIGENNYNIGYAAWESSKLPDHWTPIINELDEIWVPCRHNVRVFKDSGVTIPIHCIPHTFEEKYIFENKGNDLALGGVSDDDFVFYSIFQWTERKHPLGLLTAYLTEFTDKEDVAMVIKTYFINPENPKEAVQLRDTIGMIKNKLHMKGFPKVLLISSLLSREQLLSIHTKCDCYVSLHRCEGFGIPLVEAMVAGNPVIATNYGGPDDFGFPETGLPVNYTMTPCFGMPWPLYTGKMEWAEPDIMHARKQMRWVYENREEAKNIGKKGQEWVKHDLSWDVIGNKMKERLEEIERKLR